MPEQPTILCLGRNGDIISALPIAYELFRRGQRPKFLVSEACADMLSAVSYVDPVVWAGDYSKPSQAVLWFRRHHGAGPIITAQCYMHVDQRHLTSSYQKESWRLAGWLDKFGALPLVIDQRSAEREDALRDQLPPIKSQILVATGGISSPYIKAEELLTALRERFSDLYDVMDLREVQAEKPQDLLGLFDDAALLITVDTLHLHLARASRVPVVTITNLGWKGSIPPPNTVAHWDYNSPTAAIVQSAEKALAPLPEAQIWHVSDIFGQSERHLRARSTWGALGMQFRHQDKWGQTSQRLGDRRHLPFLKDVLAHGMEQAAEHDIILWTNDDVAMDPQVPEWARRHVGFWGAASMRRDTSHMGRDLFAFRKDWLKTHWREIPDFLLGAPFWDLVLAAIIRKARGIVTTKANLEYDIFPCETEHRYALHEDHPSDWAKGEYVYPGNIYNRKLFGEWARTQCPTLKI